MQKKEIEKTMTEIYTYEEQNKEKSTELLDITYYKELLFKSANFAENDIFITKLEKTDKNKTVELFKIYDKDGNVIASVDEKGKINFMPEYIEKIKQEYEHYFELLKMDDAILELPKELEKTDIQLDRKQIEEKIEEKDTKEEVKEEKQNDIKEEDNQKQEIAKKKGIPENNVLIVKENSNLYKDHPELEKGLIFSKNEKGIIEAEYIDENGGLQPSKYIMPSDTAIRQETISMGKDGNPVTKETPYQVMKTKNLTGRDQDVRDIRINVKVDIYGYLDIEEARQGRSGEWASHDIEVKGRDYNDEEINRETSMRTGMADPDKEIAGYNKTKEIESESDVIQYDEMYLMQNSDEIISNFVKEGYQKNEAIQIFDYMIGEEKLTEEEAKQKVNQKIEEKEEIAKETEQQIETDEEEKTPWGDAQTREERKRM